VLIQRPKATANRVAPVDRSSLPRS
jgi:hypothetical protein